MSFPDLRDEVRYLQKYVERFGQIPIPEPAPPEKQGEGCLKCTWCGGQLANESVDSRRRRSFAIARMVSPPPRSKRKPNREWSLKKRIAKKQRIAWIKKVGMIAAIGAPLVGRNVLICTHCGKMDSFYGVIARNIIQIEPMPLPSGLVYYLDETYDKPESE